MGKLTKVEENKYPSVYLDPYHPFIQYLLTASDVSLVLTGVDSLGIQDIMNNDCKDVGVKEIQKWLAGKLLERNPFDDLRTTDGKQLLSTTMKWSSLSMRLQCLGLEIRRIRFDIHYTPKRGLHTIHLTFPVSGIELSEEELLKRYVDLMSDIVGESNHIDFNENQYGKSAKLWESLPGRNKDGEKDSALNNVYFKLKNFMNKASSYGKAELKVNGDDFVIIHDLLEPFMIYGNKPFNPLFRGYENVPLTWWITLAHGKVNYEWVDDHAVFTLTKEGVD